MEWEELVAAVGPLDRQRRRLERRVERAVIDARSAGATWTALARELGVSPQAVRKRYGRAGGGE